MLHPTLIGILCGLVVAIDVSFWGVSGANENPLSDLLGKSFLNFSNSGAELKKVFEAPTDLLKNPANLMLGGDALSKLFNSPLSITEKGLDSASEKIDKVANTTSQVVDKALDILPGKSADKGGLTFSEDYEDLRLEEMGLEGLRKPRYYSRDCEFRIACELGLKMKPVAIKPVSETLKSNKLMKNLHNRYTRAFTYGLVNDNCKPYYCLLLQFLSGPKQMAKGVAELLNKVANPEFYD